MIKELALNTLSTLYEEGGRYHEANKILRELEPEFPTHVTAVNSTCSTSIVNLLDAILGDEIASYFLWEALNMKNGGMIQEVDGKQYPIRNMEDVRNYVYRKDVK